MIKQGPSLGKLVANTDDVDRVVTVETLQVAIKFGQLRCVDLVDSRPDARVTSMRVTCTVPFLGGQGDSKLADVFSKVLGNPSPCVSYNALVFPEAFDSKISEILLWGVKLAGDWGSVEGDE